MEQNNDITMMQLLTAVNNLTNMVNDLKSENELLRENKKSVKEKDEKKKIN